MPSRSRKHQLSGALVFHAYNRSADQGAIFHDDDDSLHFLKLLRRYKEEFLLSVYHWAIMNTHFHLEIEMEEPEEISVFMAGINRAYTHYHHRKYLTRGFLWQGRFKLQPVCKQSHLLACARYIERNPARAGIVRNPEEYPWSSARYYCFGTTDGITSEDPLYPQMGADADGRRAFYRKFLSGSDPEEEKLFRNLRQPVGPEEFLHRLQLRNGRLLPRRRGSPRLMATTSKTRRELVPNGMASREIDTTSMGGG